MSVTFQLDMDYDIASPFAGANEPTDAELDAYYAKLDLMGEFNVANGNARFVLANLLGLEGESVEYLCGSLDKDTFQMRVSMADNLNVYSGVAPASVSKNVIDCGRSVDQCERYMKSLVRLSNLCDEFGVGVRWG